MAFENTQSSQSNYADTFRRNIPANPTSPVLIIRNVEGSGVTRF